MIISKEFPAALLRQFMRLPIRLAVLWLLPMLPVIAHPELMTTVRHRATISAGRKNVDVMVELIIGEIPSFAERLLMDANQDNSIDASEADEYLDEHWDVLQQAVSLSINDQPLQLLFLYDPEIDLDSAGTWSTAHLTIRFYYFARTPVGIKAGDEVVVEDRLWSHAPGLGSYQVTGHDGFELIAEKSASTLWSASCDDMPLVMRARYHGVPGTSHHRPQSGHFHPSQVNVPRTKAGLAANTSHSMESSETKEAVGVKAKRPPQELSATRIHSVWLFGFVAIFLVAGIAAGMVNRRGH